MANNMPSSRERNAAAFISCDVDDEVTGMTFELLDDDDDILIQADHVTHDNDVDYNDICMDTKDINFDEEMEDVEAPNISIGLLADPTEAEPDCNSEESGFDRFAGNLWIYPTNYPVRDYQYNIVQKALYKNTLVVLPTGLGKTFIAAVVMYNFFRWFPQGKIVFMAPTKPLVAQQIQACYNIMGIPKADTVEMTGTMAPAVRQKAWMEKRVVFLTPQVMTNDLSRGSLTAKSIKCLVLDEAHKALGNHAYCQVVRELGKFTRHFRILALSATPGGDLKAVQQVMNNLLISHIELRSEDSIDICPYTHERKVEKIVIPLGDELNDIKQKYVQIMSCVVQRLIRSNVLFCKDASKVTTGGLLKARIAFRQNPPHNLQQAQKGFIEADFSTAISLCHGFNLLQNHGLRSLYNFLTGIITGEKGYGQTRQELLRNANFNGIVDYLKHKFLLSAGNGVPSVAVDQKMVVSHPKVQKLEEIVVAHFRSFQNNGEETRVMVFSEYRDSVQEITAVLNQHQPLIKAMSFIGQSSAGKSTKGFTQKDQLMVMRSFREGGYNTLISTCVGEEGLDIGDIDLIICFDAHKSPVRLVQRMGRTGRKRKGRIVMLVTEGKEDQIYNHSVYSMKSIHKAILNGSKSLQFYPNNPRMVPSSVTPQCHKMHITLAADSARSKSKTTRKSKDLDRKKSKKISEVFNNQVKKVADNGYLTAEEYAEIREEFSQLTEIAKLVPRSKCLVLSQKPKDLQDQNDDSTGQQINFAEWMPWQNRLQSTIYFGHSIQCVNLVKTSEFIELQHCLDDEEDNYGLEMSKILKGKDIGNRNPNSSTQSSIFSFFSNANNNPDKEQISKLHQENNTAKVKSVISNHGCNKKKPGSKSLRKKAKVDETLADSIVIGSDSSSDETSNQIAVTTGNVKSNSSKLFTELNDDIQSHVSSKKTKNTSSKTILAKNTKKLSKKNSKTFRSCHKVQESGTKIKRKSALELIESCSYNIISEEDDDDDDFERDCPSRKRDGSSIIKVEKANRETEGVHENTDELDINSSYAQMVPNDNEVYNTECNKFFSEKLNNNSQTKIQENNSNLSNEMQHGVDLSNSAELFHVPTPPPLIQAKELFQSLKTSKDFADLNLEELMLQWGELDQKVCVDNERKCESFFFGERRSDLRFATSIITTQNDMAMDTELPLSYMHHPSSALSVNDMDNPINRILVPHSKFLESTQESPSKISASTCEKTEKINEYKNCLKSPVFKNMSNTSSSSSIHETKLLDRASSSSDVVKTIPRHEDCINKDFISKEDVGINSDISSNNLDKTQHRHAPSLNNENVAALADHLRHREQSSLVITELRTTNFSPVYTRTSPINNMSPVNEKMSSVDNKASTVTNRTSTITNRMSPVNHIISHVDNRMNPITNRMSPVTNRIKSTTNRMSSANYRMGSVDKTMSPLIGMKQQDSCHESFVTFTQAMDWLHSSSSEENIKEYDNTSTQCVSPSTCKSNLISNDMKSSSNYNNNSSNNQLSNINFPETDLSKRNQNPKVKNFRHIGNYLTSSNISECYLSNRISGLDYTNDISLENLAAGSKNRQIVTTDLLTISQNSPAPQSRNFDVNLETPQFDLGFDLDDDDDVIPPTPTKNSSQDSVFGLKTVIESKHDFESAVSFSSLTVFDSKVIPDKLESGEPEKCEPVAMLGLCADVYDELAVNHFDLNFSSEDESEAYKLKDRTNSLNQKFSVSELDARKEQNEKQLSKDSFNILPVKHGTTKLFEHYSAIGVSEIRTFNTDFDEDNSSINNGSHKDITKSYQSNTKRMKLPFEVYRNKKTEDKLLLASGKDQVSSESEEFPDQHVTKIPTKPKAEKVRLGKKVLNFPESSYQRDNFTVNEKQKCEHSLKESWDIGLYDFSNDKAEADEFVEQVLNINENISYVNKKASSESLYPTSGTQSTSEVKETCDVHCYNKASPVVSNKASPVASNKASPVVSNKASPVVSNKASPVVSNKASPFASNKASPFVSYNFNSTTSIKASTPVQAKPGSSYLFSDVMNDDDDDGSTPDLTPIRSLNNEKENVTDVSFVLKRRKLASVLDSSSDVDKDFKSNISIVTNQKRARKTYSSKQCALSSVKVVGEFSSEEDPQQRILSDSFDHDLDDFVDKSPFQPKQNIPRKKITIKRTKEAAGFLEKEAEVSGEDMSSDENEEVDDFYENSFIDNNTEMTQTQVTDMKAVYLKSIKSPVVDGIKGRYKIQCNANRKVNPNIFSQELSEDHGMSEYEEDSFCVGSDEEDSSYHEKESQFSNRKKQKLGKTGQLKKRHRIKMMQNSSTEEDINILSTQEFSTRPSKNGRRVIFSSSEDEETIENNKQLPESVNLSNSCVMFHINADTSSVKRLDADESEGDREVRDHSNRNGNDAHDGNIPNKKLRDYTTPDDNNGNFDLLDDLFDDFDMPSEGIRDCSKPQQLEKGEVRQSFVKNKFLSLKDTPSGFGQNNSEINRYRLQDTNNIFCDSNSNVKIKGENSSKNCPTITPVDSMLGAGSNSLSVYNTREDSVIALQKQPEHIEEPISLYCATVSPVLSHVSPTNPTFRNGFLCESSQSNFLNTNSGKSTLGMSRDERLRRQKEKQEMYKKKLAQVQHVSGNSTMLQAKDLSNASGSALKSDSIKASSGSLAIPDTSKLVDVDDDALKYVHGQASPAFTKLKETDSTGQQLHILVDSKEISGAQEIISALRLKHSIEVTARKLSCCDYILSNHLAADRILWSNFSNSGNRSKFASRLCEMQAFYERCIVIVETDRVKAGQERSKKPIHRTKYVDTTLSYLSQSKVKVYFTDNVEETATVLADLCQVEKMKGRALNVPVQLSSSKEEIFNFIKSMPEVTVPQALNLTHRFRSLHDLITSSVSVILERGCMTLDRAKSIHKFLRLKFDVHAMTDPKS